MAFCGKRDNEPDIAYFSVKHCELAYVRDDHPLASADTITFAELNGWICTPTAGAPSASAWRRCSRRPTCGVSLGYDDDVSMGSFLSYSGGNAERYAGPLGAQLFSNLHQVRVEGIPNASTRCIWPTTRSTCTPAVADHRLREGYPGNDLIGQVLPTRRPVERRARSAETDAAVWVSGRSTAQPSDPPGCLTAVCGHCAVCGHLLREADKARPVVV
ncbi:MAG: hypothetical protein ACLTEX_03235 [Eggerthella lenta]